MLTEENKNIFDEFDQSVVSNSVSEIKQEENTESNNEIESSNVIGLELAEQKDKFLRLYAEFDNFKRRTAKERIDLIKTAGQEVIIEMIGVLDDFDRAQKLAKDSDNLVAYPEGMAILHHKLLNILQHRGLNAMISTGMDFDPDRHEAIAEVPASDEKLRGKVIDTLEKGYQLSDKIIRFAKVVVGK